MGVGPPELAREDPFGLEGPSVGDGDRRLAADPDRESLVVARESAGLDVPEHDRPHDGPVREADGHAEKAPNRWVPGRFPVGCHRAVRRGGRDVLVADQLIGGEDLGEQRGHPGRVGRPDHRGCACREGRLGRRVVSAEEEGTGRRAREGRGGVGGHLDDLVEIELAADGLLDRPERLDDAPLAFELPTRPALTFEQLT